MEEWKVIPGYSNYAVSNLGKVKNLTSGRLIGNNPVTGSTIYRQVSIKHDLEKRFIKHHIHRLVAENFVENLSNYNYVNHINEDKFDNRACNLEWVSNSQNQKHKHRNGTVRTSNRAVGKFTTEGVLVKEYSSITNAAKEEGCPRGAIDQVVQGIHKTSRGFVWKYLDQEIVQS